LRFIMTFNMFDRNVSLLKFDKCFTIQLPLDNELERLNYKHKGMVNVKISSPLVSKTLQQIKTIHALLNAFYFSGFASIPENCTNAKFKLLKKVEYGTCFETEYKNKLVRVPISLADYSKEEMASFIDKLLIEIKQSGAESDNAIQIILKGMEENR
jgi:hypothetical protein